MCENRAPMSEKFDSDTQTFLEDLSRVIRGMILDSDRTQQDLEGELGWPPRTISRLLHGKAVWRCADIYRLLRVLNADLEHLTVRMKLRRQLRETQPLS